MKAKSAVVVLSGGQDSTTCLFWAKEHFEKVYAITFDYGQRHAIELDAARKIAMLGCVEEHVVIEVGPILRSTSPLVSSNELEQYADEYSLPGGLEKTFVPGRNLLFLTLAANYAYSIGSTNLVTGVCEEDSGGYPDCRQDFINATQDAIREGLGYDDSDEFRKLKIHTPLMNLTKAESVHMAHGSPRCWAAMAWTHTAYDGAYPPIGKDHATLLRAKGFLEAGLPDPLILRAVSEGLMDLPKSLNYLKAGETMPMDFGDEL
jgi:7-cyano-7-deazaguanine synthase